MKGWKNYQQLLNKWRKARVKTWLLIILLIIFSALGAWGLRHNNVTMMRLRDDVLVADRQAEDVDVPLNKLMNYSLSHMNASVHKLGLTASYKRDSDKAAKQAVQDAKISLSDDASAEGQKFCEQSIGVDSTGYTTKIAQCVQNYAASHLPKNKDLNVEYPDESLYYYNFASPLWSADGAGVSLLLAAITAIWLLGRLTIRLVALLIVRYRQR